MSHTLRSPDGFTVTVHRADTAWRRMVGLLGRRMLPADEGLLLSPAWSIHTWGMRFPIDVIFLDRQDIVLRVAAHVAPWRLVSSWGAHGVVELAAGSAERLGIRPGTSIGLTPPASSP
jgi:uncharacterized protein